MYRLRCQRLYMVRNDQSRLQSQRRIVPRPNGDVHNERASARHEEYRWTHAKPNNGHEAAADDAASLVQ
jgi:hypothetical protein